MRKTKIYIAGGWDERITIVKPFVDRITAAGFEVTFDWTLEKGPKDASGGDSALETSIRRRAALLDSQAVDKADTVWFITPGYKGSSGSWFEFGYAIALATHATALNMIKKHVIVSGPNWKRSIFTELAEKQFDTHEEAFTHLLEKAAAGLEDEMSRGGMKPCIGCIEDARASRSFEQPMPGIKHTCTFR